jgi:cardiolipin synthase
MKLASTDLDQDPQFMVEGCDYYENFKKIIRSAVKSVQLQTYIFENDDFGMGVWEALVDAANRGVRVEVVVDAVGSSQLSSTLDQEASRVGIDFKRFNHSGIFGGTIFLRRLHHKILVADERIAVVGGINVIDTMSKELRDQHFDFAVQVSGPVVETLASYCKAFHSRVSGRLGVVGFIRARRNLDRSTGEVRFLVNDWIWGKNQIAAQYSKQVDCAQTRILILNSYFFPEKKFLKKLVSAAKRGVKVQIVLSSYSDWPVYVYAVQYLYVFLIRNGIEVFEWKRSILHAKIAVIDDAWVTVGSFNLNFTSFRQNLELNASIYSEEFSRRVEYRLKQEFEGNLQQVDLTDIKLRSSFVHQVARLFFYTIFSILGGLSQIFLRQNRDV